MAPSPDSSLRADAVRFGRVYGVYFFPLAFLVYLILETYQIDCRSFYLAGKSVLWGLDPYLNYVGVHPEFYGPVNAELSPASGFRYPPLAALLFAPMGLVEYQTAKALFSLAMVFFLGLLAFGMARHSQFRLPGEAILFMLMSFPVLALVERGQVDSLLVYLVVLAFWLDAAPGKGRWLSPLVLAFAAIFKIFPAVALLHFLVRRRWGYVAQTLAWGALLLGLPRLYFGPAVYGHFWQRTLPQVFGGITTDLPLDVHGQGVRLNRVVQTVDSYDLLASHDFVNGYMNPLLQHSTAGALICGAVLSVLLLGVMGRCSASYQFYALLTVINLYNPVAWIMGLVWYLPLFLYLMGRVTTLGKALALLPLFMPPFLNSNAIWAYVMAVLFALTAAYPRLHRGLLTTPERL